MHFGSLVAALGSYLDARAVGGVWLVRMEDVDTTREVPGAADDILRTLERFGFEWDDSVVCQSARTELYEAALAELQRKGLVFSCGCSRKVGKGRCTGECGGGPAWRLRADSEVVSFQDRRQGWQEFALDDFVVKRADGLFAYQLAVVVDDAAQGITDVVRGADLLDSTPRQIALQSALGYDQPRYLHLPEALNELGQKLSKQTLAPPVGDRPVGEMLGKALEFLGLHPGVQLRAAGAAEILSWGMAHWR